MYVCNHPQRPRTRYMGGKDFHGRKFTPVLVVNFCFAHENPFQLTSYPWVSEDENLLVITEP